MKHTQELAATLAAMSDAERAAMAASRPIITIEGHPLSIRNNVLVAMQTAAPVTVVGGFAQWIKAGRCVSKGQAALWILCPMTRKAKDDEKADDAGNCTFFREVAVFDITQTAELGAVKPEATQATQAPRARKSAAPEYSEQFTQL